MEIPQTIHTVQLERAALSLTENFARDRGAAIQSHASADAYLRAHRGDPGCVLFDVDALGDEEVLRTLQRMANQASPIPIIILAHAPGVRSAVRWMQAGAAAVLEKPVEGEELASALDRALRRDEEQRQAGRQAEELQARFAMLTEGEAKVLEQLVAGLANKNIAADLQIGLRTVELRRAKILKKTGAKSLAELVRLAMIAHPGWLHNPPRQ